MSCSSPMDAGPYPQSLPIIQHPTIYMQWIQSHVQRLHDLGNYRTPAYVPIWTSIQCSHVFLHSWGEQSVQAWHIPIPNSWSSPSSPSLFIYYTDGTLTVGYDLSTYLYSSLVQARFPLPVQVCQFGFGLFLINTDISKQPNTPSGSLLGSFSTTTSGSVLLNGGSVTTVSSSPCKVGSFLTW